MSKREDFRSDLEYNIDRAARKKIGKKKRTELKYEAIRIRYFIEKDYIPDWILEQPGHHPIIIEAKGYLRPADRTKMIAVKKANPSLDIRFIFPQDNKLTKKSKMRYSDWCNKNGFKYHIGTQIPDEWFVKTRKRSGKTNRSNRRRARTTRKAQ